MYQPAPARPKKTAICRTRTGCLSCKQRRRKCDGLKPACSSCLRLGKRCEREPKQFAFIDVQSHLNKKHKTALRSSDVRLDTPPSIYPDSDRLTKALVPNTFKGHGPKSPCHRHDELTDRVVVPSHVHHSLEDAARYYLTAWTTHCMPAVHSAFQNIAVICGTSRLIENAIAALSACRMSRKLPERRLCIQSGLGTCFKPDTGHECLGGEFYGLVLRQVRRLSDEDASSCPPTVFAVLVLLCYVESSMGNFTQFRVHSQAVERLSRSFPTGSMLRISGLLAAWVEVKMQNWWRRAHFATPAFFQEPSEPLLDSNMFNMMSTAGHRRAVILTALCESCRVRVAEIADCYDRSLEYGTMNDRQPHMTNLGRPQLDNLQCWLTARCEYKMSDRDTIVGTTKTPDEAPIFFNSLAEALDCAYAITAIFMHLTDCSTNATRRDMLLQRLLRIAAGIDWDECIRLNVFSIGLTGCLFACALQARRLDVGVWVQKWLEQHMNGSTVMEEGNFPLFQLLDALGVVNRERRNGVDVIALFRTIDDEGGNGKFGSYVSQSIDSFLVYARNDSTGQLYSYQISLADLIRS